MGFLAPWFLAGMAAISLPIYVHLMRQHKATPLKFSSLMFFERRTQSSIRHRRLKYLLLFALRTALVVLLALAFANPFVTRKAGALAGGAKMVAIAIDNSFSMRARGRLDRAKREASALLSGWRGGDRGQVLAFGSSVELMTQATGDVAEMRAAIEAIGQGDSRSSYAELARALRAIAQSSGWPVEAHLFSDMQKSSLPPSFADLQLAANTKLVSHALASEREPNWAVESVSAPRRIFDPKKTRVQATVAGYGTPAARRSVSLAVNGRVLETKSVDVPAGGRATVEFLKLDAPYGWCRGEVRIDSADQLPDDDRLNFAVERADPRLLLFVHEARQPRGLLYFHTALDTSTEAAFTLEAVTPEQAANLALAKFAVVVLCDVASLPPGFEDGLRNWVRGGGGLLIAAGPAMGTRTRIPVLDEAVSDVRYSGREGERFQAIASLDETHPVLRRAGKLEGVKFYQRVRIEPGKARVLARLADGTPLVLEKEIGEGRVIAFSSTFDNISNDFPLHASFVPFVEQATNYLAGQEERSSSYPVDSFLELRRAKEQGTAVEVLDPAGKRALTLAEAAGAKNIRLSANGFYDVRRANGRHELAAVNADRRESDLDVVPPDTLALWQNTGQGAAAGSSEEQQKPWSLWWYAMLAVFLVAMAESILGVRYLSAEGEQ